MAHGSQGLFIDFLSKIDGTTKVNIYFAEFDMESLWNKQAAHHCPRWSSGDGIGNAISLQRIYEYEVRVMGKLACTQEEHGGNKIYENTKYNNLKFFHSVMPSKLCIDSFSWYNVVWRGPDFAKDTRGVVRCDRPQHFSRPSHDWRGKQEQQAGPQSAKVFPCTKPLESALISRNLQLAASIVSRVDKMNWCAAPPKWPGRLFCHL